MGSSALDCREGLWPRAGNGSNHQALGCRCRLVFLRLVGVDVGANMENEDKIAAAIEQAGTGNRNGHTLLGVGYCSRQGDQSFRGTPEEIEESRRQAREISTLIAISVFPARGNYCTKLLTLQSKLLTSLILQFVERNLYARSTFKSRCAAPRAERDSIMNCELRCGHCSQ